ncbi:hypothetical protein HY631_04375 [Candidatus Uhrbacteria bacterium]|nr:hypothetical protein [Candidatus Uhrbacteria bacterium]
MAKRLSGNGEHRSPAHAAPPATRFVPLAEWLSRSSVELPRAPRMHFLVPMRPDLDTDDRLEVHVGILLSRTGVGGPWKKPTEIDPQRFSEFTSEKRFVRMGIRYKDGMDGPLR